MFGLLNCTSMNMYLLLSKESEFQSSRRAELPHSQPFITGVPRPRVETRYLICTLPDITVAMCASAVPQIWYYFSVIRKVRIFWKKDTMRTPKSRYSKSDVTDRHFLHPAHTTNKHACLRQVHLPQLLLLLFTLQ